MAQNMLLKGVRAARSSEYGTYKTVKARFWPWRPVIFFERFDVVSSSLGSGWWLRVEGGGCGRCTWVCTEVPRSRSLRWFSRCGPLTRIGHIPGVGRPLLREGGPISYEATPSASFWGVSSTHPPRIARKRASGRVLPSEGSGNNF